VDRFIEGRAAIPIIDHLRDSVVIASRNGKIVEANAAFLSLVGTSKEKVVGRDSSDVEPLETLANVMTSTVLHRMKHRERFVYRGRSLEATVTPIVIEGEVAYVLVVLVDISAFVNLEAQYLRKNRELIITNTLSSAFISSGDIDSVFSDLLEKALIIAHLTLGWIMLRDGDGLEMKVSNGLSADLRKRIQRGNLNPLLEKALSFRAPLHVLEKADTMKDEVLSGEGIAFLVVIPLRTGAEVLGCLVLASRTETVFDFDLASLLSLIGNNLSMIADKVRLFQETERLAITDGLTGLYNIRHFYAELDKEIARAERYSSSFSIALFDVDDFKVVNDTFGHQAGDEVLRDVAAMILHVSRKTDVVARYGGEEFITLLPNTPKKEAFHHACRIRDAVELKRYLGSKSVSLTISGGVASYPVDANVAKNLLSAADVALYSAKAAGKKSVHCYGRDGSGRC
jgi:diguanylate cyclase (GGDEF)-like protein/PAS domain S-box-containing protein